MDLQIFESISRIIEEIGPIAKTKTNSGQGYKFRGVDDVMNHLSGLLAKHQVFIVPTVLDMKREEKESAKGAILNYTILTVQYRFYTLDGSFIDSIVVGEAMDGGDKSCNKAMSTAFKYACFQVFCIATEEMKDSDDDNYTVVNGLKTKIQCISALAQQKKDEGLLTKEIYTNILDLYDVKSINEIKSEVQAQEIYNYIRDLKAVANG